MPELFLTIRYAPGPGASVQVEGNVASDRVLAYGLLEAARDAIKNAIDSSPASSIVAPPPGALPPFHKG